MSTQATVLAINTAFVQLWFIGCWLIS